MFRLKGKRWLFIFLSIIGISSLGFISGGNERKLPGADNKEIHWMSFDEAMALNQAHPKKIFIDIFTPWCGWCKKMDAETYTDPAIISYINTYFYAIRLDAETSDTFHFQGHAFYNQKPHTRGYTNELASSLLDGKLAYPTTVYMDENVQRLTFVQSYISAADLMPILQYFAENKYKTMKFDDFKKSYANTSVTSAGK